MTRFEVQLIDDRKNGDKLDQIITLLTQLGASMPAEFDALTAQIAANNSTIDSAIVLINGIAAQIAAAGVDPVALQAITDGLAAKDAELAAAVVANTVPAPVVTP